MSKYKKIKLLMHLNIAHCAAISIFGGCLTLAVYVLFVVGWVVQELPLRLDFGLFLEISCFFLVMSLFLRVGLISRESKSYFLGIPISPYS
jgi:hypothetical protein